MRILNIGFDKTLAGAPGPGDAIVRHREYGKYLESLDIIVCTKKNENLPVFSISEKVTGYPTSSQNKLWFIFDAYRLAKKIQQSHKIDIVVAQDPFGPGIVGWWLKKKYGVKLQINFHGDFWDNPHWLAERWYHRIYLWISKCTIPRADALRVMSEGQKNKLLQAGVAASKIRVISTPVDVKRFMDFRANATDKQRQVMENLRPQKDTPVLIAVGRNDKAKDYPTLFAVVRIVKERLAPKSLRVVLVGPDLSKIIPADLTGIVVAAGRVDSQELPSYYYGSDILVHSSSSESFGKVLVEANACGRPVVSTATTGAQEIIHDGYNGFLVPIKDVEAMTEKILELLAKPAAAESMGKNGQELMAEKFGQNTEKIVNFWKDIIGNTL